MSSRMAAAREGRRRVHRYSSMSWMSLGGMGMATRSGSWRFLTMTVIMLRGPLPVNGPLVLVTSAA